jgi:hypothetical protein
MEVKLEIDIVINSDTLGTVVFRDLLSRESSLQTGPSDIPRHSFLAQPFVFGKSNPCSLYKINRFISRGLDAINVNPLMSSVNKSSVESSDDPLILVFWPLSSGSSRR